MIAQALSRLPDHSHHQLVLRELEGLSYRELSGVMGIPMGTGVLLAVVVSELAVIPYKQWRKRVRTTGPVATTRPHAGAH